MIKISNISCVIIAKNAEATLALVLSSLQDFEDIVLYSNNSTDKTNIIAKSFANVNLVIGDFEGFGPTKNRAATYAKNNWILSLDADEVLSEEFVNKLSTLILKENHVYSVLRKNYYKIREIKNCWGNDIITRLYNRLQTSFSDKKVHEYIIETNFQVEQLQGTLQHYPYSTVSDFIIKLDRYSTIFAQDNVGKKSSSPAKAFFNALFSFTKTYIFKRGFLDGYPGLIISFSHMATNFYKYIKLYEYNKELDSQ
jgi:glycosyltransferase involved in cell wall biosynthesis